MVHLVQGIYRPECHLAGTDMDAGLAEVLKQEEKGPAINTLPQVIKSFRKHPSITCDMI